MPLTEQETDALYDAAERFASSEHQLRALRSFVRFAASRLAEGAQVRDADFAISELHEVIRATQGAGACLDRAAELLKRERGSGFYDLRVCGDRLKAVQDHALIALRALGWGGREK